MRFIALGVDIDLIISGINYSLLVGLALAILFGFLKGTRRSFTRFLTRVIPLLILLIFLDVFALSLIDYNFSSYFTINQGNSLHDVVRYYAKDFLDVQFANGGEIDKLTTSLTLALARLIVFYAGVVVCLSITAITNLILFIIFKFVDKRREKEEGKRKKGIVSRFIGALFSGLTYISIFVIVAMPLFGPITLVKELETEIKDLANNGNTHEEQLSQQDETIDDIYKIVDGLDKITFRTILNAFSGKKKLDLLYFGYLTRIQTNEGTLNLAYLVDDTRDAFHLYQNYFQLETPNYNDLLIYDADRIEEFIKRQKFVGVFAPAVIEYVELTEVFKDLNLDYTALKMINWKAENEAINDIIVKAISLLKAVEFDFNEPLKALENPLLDNSLGDIGLALSKSEVFTKVGLKLLNKEVNSYLSQIEKEKNITLTSTKAALDLTSISDDEWKDNFITLSNIARAAAELGLFGDGFNYDETKSDALKRLIIMPFHLSMIKNNGEALFNELLSLADIKETLIELGLSSLNGTGVNWEEEPTAIAEAAVALLNLFGDKEYNLDNIINQIGTEKLSLFIDKLLSSQFLRINLIALIDYQLETLIGKQENLTAEQKQELTTLLKFGSLSEEDLKQDVETFIEIYKGLDEMKVFSEEPNDFSNIESLTSVFLKIFSLKIVKGSEEKIFNLTIDLVGLQPVLDTLNLKLKTENIDWEKEPTKLAEVINALSAFGDISSFDINSILTTINEEGGRNKVINLLNALCDSSIFAPNIPKIINQALDSASLDEWYSDWFKSQLLDDAVIDNQKWKSEVNTLADILFKSQDSSLDLNNVSLENPSSLTPLKELLLLLTKSDIFKLDSIKTYLETLINNAFGTALLIETTPTKATWPDEIETIFSMANLLSQIGSIDGNDLKENNQNVIDLLNLMEESIMLKPLQKEIVQVMINKSGFNSYIDIENINFEIINWSDELMAINKITTHFDNLSSGGLIENFTEETIMNLMLDASNGQIASLIIGKILNDQFESLFGDKNPSVDGALKYDFTKSNTLAENASSMSKLISLGNALKTMFGSSNPTIAQTDSLSAAIKNLHEEGRTRPTFIDDYMPSILKFAGKDTELTSAGLAGGKTYEEEGDLLKEFFDTYHQRDNLPLPDYLVAMANATNKIQSESYLAKIIINSWSLA